MAYQVLARKSRPQDFSSLIGQEAIVTALRNALVEERIAQAYLFSGIRGVGKTSAARVLAKALNCERGPAADPCNECQVCLDITRGGDLDVLEVDAATYSKVEQVRELTESLKYGPSRDRYKVVVLDEVHRFSRQAFDALLKIVEEPPPHLVFIFATTEIEAVPATILSRCQEFQFRRVPVAVLADHLRSLCQQENIEASDNALRMIARAGEGSVRDAVAMLDQMATFGAGSISDEDAARLFGGLDAALFEQLLASMLDGDAPAVSRAAAQVAELGKDPRHVYAQFLEYGREALHLALGSAPDQVDLPEDDARRLAELARQAGYENLLRLVHQLLSSEAVVRRSEAGLLALEIAWLRAAELPKLTRLEDLLSGTATRPSLPVSAAVRPAPVRPAPERPPAPQNPAPQNPAPAQAVPREATPAKAPPVQPSRVHAGSPEPQRATEPPARSAPEPPPEPDVPLPEPPPDYSDHDDHRDNAAHDEPDNRGSRAPRPSSAGDSVARFLETVGQLKTPLRSRLERARVTYHDGVLEVRHAPHDPLRKAMERSSNQDAVREAGRRVWGLDDLEVRLLEDADMAEAEASPPPEQAPSNSELDAVREQPQVQAVLELFNGTVESVTKDGSS